MLDTKTPGRNGIIPGAVSTKECADTGMAMVLICLLGAWFSGERYWLASAMVLLVLNMTIPRLYTLPAKLWLGLSLALGTVMSKVVLGLVFFLVLTPLALLRRMAGHDPMKQKAWKATRDSAFETRDHTFLPEEIERPY